MTLLFSDIEGSTAKTEALGDHVPGGNSIRHFHMAMIENALGNRAAAAAQFRTAIDNGLKIGQLPQGDQGDAQAFRDLSRRLLPANK